MKKTIFIIGAVIILAIGVIAFGRTSTNSQQPEKANFSSVQNDVMAGARLYDVRTSQEYASGHFTSAENLSLQDMQAGKLPAVAKDTKLYVYCQSGNRSSQAARLLKEAGFTNVIDLGGLQDVQSIGGKLVKEG